MPARPPLTRWMKNIRDSHPRGQWRLTIWMTPAIVHRAPARQLPSPHPACVSLAASTPVTGGTRPPADGDLGSGRTYPPRSPRSTPDPQWWRRPTTVPRSVRAGTRSRSRVSRDPCRIPRRANRHSGVPQGSHSHILRTASWRSGAPGDHPPAMGFNDDPGQTRRHVEQRGAITRTTRVARGFQDTTDDALERSEASRGSMLYRIEWKGERWHA